MAIAFKGQVPTFRSSRNVEKRNEFRNVPASDSGNRDYQDVGKFGTFCTDAEPFPNTPGVKFDTGYGLGEGDTTRGFSDPGIRQDPAYDKANYHERWSEPRVADEDQLETNIQSDDWAFRNRNRESRGFLTRPRIPTERN